MIISLDRNVPSREVSVKRLSDPAANLRPQALGGFGTTGAGRHGDAGPPRSPEGRGRTGKIPNGGVRPGDTPG